MQIESEQEGFFFQDLIINDSIVMKLTSLQEDYLKSLVCERLSNEQDSNFRIVDEFNNYRNENLACVLKNEAYQEDRNGNIAYYLVKTKNNEILFYFSLKCGLLYDEFYEGKRYEELKELYNAILKISSDPNLSVEEKKCVNGLLEQFRTKKGLKMNDLANVLKIDPASDDFSKIFGKNHISVVRTFSGVEIVHFCANDDKKNIWNEKEFQQPLGAVVFWYFVVPKIVELKYIVGCEYLFLFAADKTEDETLINYYSDKLGFERMDEHCAAIPLYDFTCQFMSQRTDKLLEKQKLFFDNFNLDDEV